MTETFTKTPGWLDWYADPTKPDFALPAGAVDAHCHVFGPGAEFPFAPERKYTPVRRLQGPALRPARPPGLQPQRHRPGDLPRRRQQRHGGRPARRRRQGPRRGDGAARRLRDRARRPARGRRARRAVQLRQAARRHALAGGPADVVARIAPFGWHVVIYFEAPDLPELRDFFTSIPLPLVVDHMGRPDVTKPRRRPGVHRVPRLHARPSPTCGAR